MQQIENSVIYWHRIQSIYGITWSRDWNRATNPQFYLP